jgi:hypothetical protein
MSARGFAGQDRAWVSEQARLGGIAAHAVGKAHKWTSDEAKAAGRKGGAATAALRGPEHFAAIGRLGHESSAQGRRVAAEAHVKIIGQRELRRLRSLIRRGVDGKQRLDSRALWVRALESRRAA